MLLQTDVSQKFLKSVFKVEQHQPLDTYNMKSGYNTWNCSQSFSLNGVFKDKLHFVFAYLTVFEWHINVGQKNDTSFQLRVMWSLHSI